MDRLHVQIGADGKFWVARIHGRRRALKRFRSRQSAVTWAQERGKTIYIHYENGGVEFEIKGMG